MKSDTQPPVMRLDAVTKVYRPKRALFGEAEHKEIVALNQVSLDIRRGEIFGIVGESGSGKTTTGRLMVKLEAPTSGKLFLDGEDMTRIRGNRLKDFRAKVQMIFQDPYQSLNPQHSILDTVAEPLLVQGVGNPKSRVDQVVEALAAADLNPARQFLYRYPHQLSGGQRQRVAIARAMVIEPEFVVADEPTSMLDATISFQIFNILLNLRDQFSTTFLFITHSLAAARYVCDRIAVIYRGHLVEMGPAKQIIEQPSHPYTRALMDALPKFGKQGAQQPYDSLLETERKIPPNEHCPFYPRCREADPPVCSAEHPDMRTVGNSHHAACIHVHSDPEGTQII
jgi:peptide/nickel transport system ATP-binding protein